MFVEQPLALTLALTGSANDIMSVLGLNSVYTVNDTPLPSGVPSGLYLIVYPSSCLNTDTG